MVKDHEMHIHLEQLHSRLPELAWKLRQVPRGAFLSSVPRGLFRTVKPECPTAYLEEIRADLVSLSQQDAYTSSALIAARVHAKINLLVRLCVLQGQQDRPANDFVKSLMTKLVTRSQQVQVIEDQITSLQEQQMALRKTLSKTEDVERQLLIQSELGYLARLLTEAKEGLR